MTEAGSSTRILVIWVGQTDLNASHEVEMAQVAEKLSEFFERTAQHGRRAETRFQPPSARPGDPHRPRLGGENRSRAEHLPAARVLVRDRGARSRRAAVPGDEGGHPLRRLTASRPERN